MLKWARNPTSASMQENEVVEERRQDEADGRTVPASQTEQLMPTQRMPRLFGSLRLGRKQSRRRNSMSELPPTTTAASAVEAVKSATSRTSNDGTSLKRWITGSLRRIGRLRKDSGSSCGASEGGVPSLRRSRSADRCGSRGSCESVVGPTSGISTESAAAAAAASLADFAETAAVICQLLGSDIEVDRRSLGHLVDGALNSPISSSFSRTFDRLTDLGLSEDAFALTSVIGQELLAAGQARRAAVCLECALRIGGDVPEARLRCSVMASLGRAHWLLGGWDSAVACMRRHLKLAESCDDPAEQSRALGNLSAALSALGRGAEAVRIERRRIRLRSQDLNLQRLSSNSTAAELTVDGQSTLGLESRNAQVSQWKSGAHQCQEDLEDSGIPVEAIAADEAERKFEHQLRVAQRLQDRKAAAEALKGIGHCQASRGDLKSAFRSHSERLSLLAELQQADDELSSACLADLVSCCRSLGRWSETLSYARRRAALMLAADSRVDSLDCLADILWHRSRNRRSEAASVFEAHENVLSALSEAQRCHGDSETLRKTRRRTWRRLGSLHLRWGELVEAELGFQESMSCALAPALEVAKAARGLAGSLLLQGRLSEAESAVQQSLAACAEAARIGSEGAPDAKAKSKSLSCLAAIRERLGDLPGALRHRQAALEAARLARSPKLLGAALGDLGDANLAVGNVASSLRCHREAVALTEASGAAAVARLAGALMSARQWEEAAEQFNKLLKLIECAAREEDSRVGEGAPGCHEAGALRLLGDCYQRLRKQRLAVGCYERCLDVLISDEKTTESVEPVDWKSPQVAGWLKLQPIGNSSSCDCEACGAATAQQPKWFARAVILNKLAECHRLCGQTRQGLLCAEKCLALASAARSSSDRDGSANAASIGSVIADAYETTGRLQLLQLAETARATSPEDGDEVQRAGDSFAAQLTAARQLGCRAREAAAAGWLGQARQLAGRWSEAVAWRRAALALAPTQLGHQRALAALAASLRKAGDVVGALEVLGDSQGSAETDGQQDGEVGRSPTQSRRWQLLQQQQQQQRGLALEQLGRLEEARNDLLMATTVELRRLDGPRDDELDSADADEVSNAALGECLDGLQRILTALGDPRSALDFAERRQLLALGENRADSDAVEALQLDLGDCEAVLCISRVGSRQVLGWLLTSPKRGGGLVASRSAKIDPSCPESWETTVTALVQALCGSFECFRCLTLVVSSELMLLAPVAAELLDHKISVAMAPSLHHCVRWRQMVQRTPRPATVEPSCCRVLAFADSEEETFGFFSSQQELRTDCIWHPLSQLKQLSTHAMEVIHLSVRLPTVDFDAEGLKISARLAVISCSAEALGTMTSSMLTSLMKLADALLAGGARAVLLSLWPSLLSRVYSRLLSRDKSGGGRIADAINSAIVEHSKHAGGPSGNLLILFGDVRTRLPTATGLLGRLLRRVFLQGQPAKVRCLLRSLLRFVESGAPAEPGCAERTPPWSGTEVRAAAARVRALVDLPDAALSAVRRLLAAVGGGEGDCLETLARLLDEASKSSTSATCLTVPSRLWRRDGCHDLLSAVGFRLCSLGADDGDAQLMLLPTASSAATALLLLGNASLSLQALADADEINQFEFLRGFDFGGGGADSVEESSVAGDSASLCRQRRRRCQPPAVVQSTVSWDSSSGYGSGRDFPGSP